jgi:ABC-type branched-subunit amino acid transport system ATPase component
MPDGARRGGDAWADAVGRAPDGELLAVEDVHAGYDAMEVLHGVSIRVAAGEIVTLIGPNGAGKSTLMKAAFGLVRASRGRVVFDGRDVAGGKPSAMVGRGLSYVPQVDNVFPSLTVEENLEMGAVSRPAGLRPRMEAMFALFPVLGTRRRQTVGTLSGGERQMVAMGRALMLEPKLIMLDEPSAGLAPIMVETVFEKIAEINRGGVAVMLVEQNARAALERSHRGYVLAGGQVRLEGAGATLLADDEVGRLYLGG